MKVKNGSSSAAGPNTDLNGNTLQYISNAKQLLNRTVDAYQKQNYTGALTATKAYLDNFEFVEAPLQRHDKTLKQNTEFMMRGDLRQQIKHNAPISDIQTLTSI
jgi:high-affinity iron transporter